MANTEQQQQQPSDSGYNLLARRDIRDFGRHSFVSHTRSLRQRIEQPVNVTSVEGK